jgi:TctA family transporter
MSYNDLIQLYFERSNAMQQYWNLYVIIVGGILAFSSLRKQPAAVTTALVCILFGLFAYKNLDAMYDVTAQRFATIQAIKEFDSANAVTAAAPKQIRDLLEPTLTPATYGSVRATHVTSDVLTIAALCAMELRRRRLQAAGAT